MRTLIKLIIISFSVYTQISAQSVYYEQNASGFGLSGMLGNNNELEFEGIGISYIRNGYNINVNYLKATGKFDYQDSKMNINSNSFAFSYGYIFDEKTYSKKISASIDFTYQYLNFSENSSSPKSTSILTLGFAIFKKVILIKKLILIPQINAHYAYNFNQQYFDKSFNFGEIIVGLGTGFGLIFLDNHLVYISPGMSIVSNKKSLGIDFGFAFNIN